MNSIIERLKDWGCDTAGAMERMADDESFYIECLHDVAEDACFDTLKEALAAGDLSKAFDAAHALKGVLANVGLTPIYNKITEIVEPLRSGSTAGLPLRLSQLFELRAKLIAILS